MFKPNIVNIRLTVQLIFLLKGHCASLFTEYLTALDIYCMYSFALDSTWLMPNEQTCDCDKRTDCSA